ncbi:phosphoribosylformylglycinamidine cyclo-ligase [Thermosulfurimonas sp. F29]|uniref:phosphoribosylformylglycinamidine cyclo-ligase n=1 Tax=Thermosulfurimonas sp. F29 TaxID=2867247 RepID=UPI001C82955E|nr:phosphoribosylformylglycinamidine cyclo-ligase [Thermosulfurimonas sp. F29]MBX6422849.1 phosphoribosylformylglycinamidine cyclo-ligase [Thermosulfurimonas sp. F29]
MSAGSRYAEAGVDIDKANRLVEEIRRLVKSTPRRGVLADIGGFSGLFALDLNHFREPVLCATTDGVGTKIKLAVAAGRHRGIGLDLVAMCVNDLIVCGARPLFFLDYLAFGRLDETVYLELLSGIAEGCRQAECALLGGETAEMPGMYPPGEYDCAGFAVGVVDRDQVIDGSEVSVGDVILGLASNGLHSNGFSLVRKIVLEELKLDLSTEIPEIGGPLAEELLKPTRIYVRTVLNLLHRGTRVKAMAHITGGGFYDNLSRVLPRGVQAVIEKSAWEMPPIFRFLMERGEISEEEMYRVFNCGIGFVLVIPEEAVEEVEAVCRGLGETVYRIGVVETASGGSPRVILV